MVTRLFGDVAKNRTIPEIAVEPTSIVIGTNDDSNVDKSKTKDVVVTRL